MWSDQTHGPGRAIKHQSAKGRKYQKTEKEGEYLEAVANVQLSGDDILGFDSELFLSSQGVLCLTQVNAKTPSLTELFFVFPSA